MKLYDISPPLSPQIKVWPGDTALSYRLCHRAGGAAAITATTHLGAHADAPAHCSVNGAGIDRVPIQAYLGPCQVIRVNARRGVEIVPGDLKTAKIMAERVLFHTNTFPDPEQWNDDFAALSPELIDYLGDKGVVLVGIDTPSIDLMVSKELPAHKRLLSRGMAVLEGLILNQVPEGLYEIIALPLKLVGLDASPVRAVLRSCRCLTG